MSERDHVRDRNERLSRNIKINSVMSLDEVMYEIRERARCHMDVPAPRANQLADEIERLRADTVPRAPVEALLAACDGVALAEVKRAVAKVRRHLDAAQRPDENGDT